MIGVYNPFDYINYLSLDLIPFTIAFLASTICVETFCNDFNRELKDVRPSSDFTLDRTEKSYKFVDFFSNALNIPEEATDPL